MTEALWSGVARAYAQSFEGLCAGTIPTLLEGIAGGARVLDVGCGTGSLLVAATRAGLAGTGVEPDPEMAALARDRLGVDIVVAGLPDLPVDAGSFDVVVANFVLNHVDDPRLAARELARVAAPAGSVRATVWPGHPPPQAALWGEALDRAGAARPVLPRLPEHLDFERSVGGLSALLGEAGLTVVRARTLPWVWRVDPDDLLTGLRAVGNFGVTWRAQPTEVQDRIGRAYAELVDPLLVSGRLEFPVECVLVEAVAGTG